MAKLWHQSVLMTMSAHVTLLTIGRWLLEMEQRLKLCLITQSHLLVFNKTTT